MKKIRPKCEYKSTGHSQVDNVEGLLTVKVGGCPQILLLKFIVTGFDVLDNAGAGTGKE